jgi:phage shock protein A
MSYKEKIGKAIADIKRFRITDRIEQLIEKRNSLEDVRQVLRKQIEEVDTILKSINKRIEELKERSTKGSDLHTFFRKKWEMGEEENTKAD